MNKDDEAFELWFKQLHDYQLIIYKDLMFLAWKEAIKYEQNKPIRTYRWNGVL